MVPRSMRRQVPMIQEETERRIRSPRRCRSVSVLTSEIHEEQSRRAAEKVMPVVREARVRDFRARRLHQTCRPVDIKTMNRNAT